MNHVMKVLAYYLITSRARGMTWWVLFPDNHIRQKPGSALLDEAGVIGGT